MHFTRLPHPAPTPDHVRESLIADPGFGTVFTDHMVVIDYDEALGGWQTPTIGPRGPIALDPAASVLHYAQEIFEGMKAYAHPEGGLSLFRPDAGDCSDYEGLARPIQLYVGRVAVEKNIEAFLKTDQPGTKVVVGDGPALSDLKARYPDAVFLGKRGGDDLARCYAGADVFVFPSKTDTFGLVMIEALACGTPVAAYPVPGPRDILTPEAGAMREDLNQAIAAALTLDREACAAFGRQFSWQAATVQFLAGLEEFDGETLTP